MSALAERLAEYLAVRRALGYRLEREGRLLPDFVAFLEGQGATYLRTDLALLWVFAPAQATPRWWEMRLGMVRGFARYLSAIDARTEIPSRDVLPKMTPRRLDAYIYTEADVLAVMAAARRSAGLRGCTYATLIGLLAATGMRVGEALALDRTDVDWNTGMLIVRRGKFGKSRELPLHPTTVQALRAYSTERDRLIPYPHSPALLLSLAGTRLHYKNVHACFLCLIERAGLAECRPHRPRLHDLRHSFAVRTLTDWYRHGRDVSARLPMLSTYLGHVCPSSTYWYLTATPELLERASVRREHALEELP